MDKNEFRQLLTSMLTAKYHLSGLDDPYDPQEYYVGFKEEDYPSLAKFKANRMVRDIFIFADKNRDGELSMKEFLHWCRRGGKEVEMLQHVLEDTLGTCPEHAHMHGY